MCAFLSSHRGHKMNSCLKFPSPWLPVIMGCNLEPWTKQILPPASPFTRNILSHQDKKKTETVTQQSTTDYGMGIEISPKHKLFHIQIITTHLWNIPKDAISQIKCLQAERKTHLIKCEVYEKNWVSPCPCGPAWPQVICSSFSWGPGDVAPFSYVRHHLRKRCFCGLW